MIDESGNEVVFGAVNIVSDFVVEVTVFRDDVFDEFVSGGFGSCFRHGRSQDFRSV